MSIVFCDIEGTSLTHADRRRLLHPCCRGVILFSRNYENKNQLQKLTTEIKQLKAPSLLISVDQEGGRVQRFREEFLQLPPAAYFGELYDHSVEKGIQAAEAGGWLMATECISSHVDFSFAPVLDLDYGESDVIGNRAFHSTVKGVTELATAFVRGMHAGGMAAVGKHFPGHGKVVADSHLELPEDIRPLDIIQKQDLKPFAELVKAGLEGIMPAHVLYSAIDDNPAGFSEFWLQTILREQLGFDGLIFSDDLSMAGALSAGSPTQRAAAAITAGCDILLVCNHPEALDEVLDHLGSEPIDTTENKQIESRLAQISSNRQYDQKALLSSSEWQRNKALMTA